MMSNKETTEVSEKNHHVKVFLPKKLVECLPKCLALPKERLRWNTNEEIASYLITFEKHEEWLSGSPKTRPQNGSLILYNRKKVKYRKDGYCWKKRRDGKTTREDHMKLKVQGMECLYGCYVHSSIVPTFHRRCYWLLQNPDIVLVHYLNVPALEDCAKLCGPILCSINSDRKEWLKWSKDELVSQLKPMFHGIKWTCSGANGTTEFSIEQLVQQVLESHQAKPPPRTHACLCSAGLGSPGHVPHKCGSTKHRIISPKLDPRPGPYPALTEVQNITEPEPPRRDLKPPRLLPADPPPELPTPLPLPPTGLPVLVMASLEKPPPPAPAPAPAPLALTPSQHLVAGGGEARGLLPSTDAAMEVGEPAPAFDPDCFLNCPARGQTYGCQPPLEPPMGGNRFFIQDDGQPPGEGGLPPVPPGSDKPPGGLQEELYALMRPGTAPPFGLAFDSLISELLTDERAPPSEPPPPTGPCTPEPGDASRPNTLVTITDFSPEWSYPEGGVKVLITGPWTEGSDAYSCLFDQVAVPAALIQPGVLRCYCPAHEAGLVALQVARDSRPVSTSVLFEYRARNFLALPSTQVDWLSLDDNQFRMSILERLEQMEKRMAEMTAAQPPAPCGPPTDATLGQVNFSPMKGARARVSGLARTRCYSWLVVGGRGGIFRATTPGKTRILSTMTAPADSFEARIVALCEQMMAGSCWLRSETLVHNMSFRGMTLLHLAAAQGYARLIQTLIRWRNLSAESLDLEQEVDPLNVDHFSCTPLMWACALGHLDAALLLYRWNQRALAIPDSLGRLPLAVARSRGHVALATCLEDLQRAEAEPPGPLNAGPGKAWPPLRIASPLSASPDTGLSGGSSASSPSERSEASLSLTSAYSSGSGARDSPPASPEAEVGAGGGPMDMCPPPGGAWYLPEPPSPPGTPAPPFFMDYEVESGAAAAPGLLGYSEDAENEDFLPPTDVLQVDMVTLARQIIEATPEHIKQEEFGVGEGPRRDRGAAGGLGGAMAWLASYLDSVDQLPGLIPHRRETGSPSQRGCLSPLQPGEPGPERRAAPPTAAGWAEFLNASANGRMESAFAGLTLSDPEQRELYEAARVIQTAFRRYKGRRLKEQQEMAAAVIQRCYRKYKQLTWIALKYALYKKMTQAAILIQSKFRSYWEQKKFQQSRRAAVLIQQCYRSYRADAPARPPRPPVPHRLRGPFLTKKQDQAARKIMRFLRRCRHRMKELKQSQELEGAQKRGLAT